MISLKLDHWTGTSFRVYNRFTKRTEGFIIDEIDWRFIDNQGVEHKLPTGYNKFSIDQAIDYFTGKNFIKTLSWQSVNFN